MTRFGDSAGGASVLDISRLSSVSTEIASLGAQVAAITSLGTITGEITALGTSANVATLAALTTTDSNGDTVALPGLSDVASITTEIGALGTTANVANINSIATSVVSGTSQLTLDAVGNALTNVNLVGSSIGNVNAVATSGAILFSALSETPAAPSPANANLDKGLKYDSSGNLVLADIRRSRCLQHCPWQQAGHPHEPVDCLLCNRRLEHPHHCPWQQAGQFRLSRKRSRGRLRHQRHCERERPIRTIG